MSFARAGTAAFLAAALAAGAARGQGGEKKEGSGAEVKDLKSAEYDAMMKMKFMACRDSGDCKPYMLEKEKAKKKKDDLALNPDEKPLPEKPPKPPKPPKENPSSGEVPGDAPSSAEPPEAAASLAEPRESVASPAGRAAAGPSPGPPPTAAQAEVQRREAGDRRARTMRRASGAADTMRRSFFPAEEPPPGNPGGPERSAPAPAADEPRTAFRPAEPRTVPEMALAAKTGFAATFRDQGLKVGAGPRGTPAIQRLDGAPASEADVERLGAALRSDPAALTRRPDFFEVLPREKFLDLKQDFTARPELRSSAFRDIALTARERDFQWSSSCSGLSGACNEHAGKASYRKGDDVPPEDLDSVWNAVQEELMGSDDEFGEYTDEERAQAAAEDLAEERLTGARRGAPNLASLLARMGELARGAGESAGIIAARSVPSPPPSPAAATGGSEFPRDGLPPAPHRAVAPAQGDAPSAPPPSPAPTGRRAGRSWNLLYVLAAAAVAVLLIRRR